MVPVPAKSAVTKVPAEMAPVAPTVTADAASIKHSDLVEKKHSKKRKKRQRGQKAKTRVVKSIGEEPRERKIGNGKVRQFDILRGDPESTKLPRKTREFLSLMKKYSSDSGANQDGPKQDHNGHPASSRKSGGKSDDQQRLHGVVAGSSNGDGKQHEASPDDIQVLRTSDMGDKSNSRQRKFDGMQPGENFAQFSARLRKESRQMILETARKGNHQREKKRAYYDKRKERALRKKRRRRGDLSDSDVEDEAADDWDEENSIAHLPSYWQEILQNNGRPISAKRRKQLKRKEDQGSDHVTFGEQAERPPQLSVLPVRRGRKDGA